MTQRERTQLRQAIRLLCSDNSSSRGWDEGMEILCRLAGLGDPLAMMEGAEVVTVDEVCRRAIRAECGQNDTP